MRCPGRRAIRTNSRTRSVKAPLPDAPQSTSAVDPGLDYRSLWPSVSGRCVSGRCNTADPSRGAITNRGGPVMPPRASRLPGISRLVRVEAEASGTAHEGTACSGQSKGTGRLNRLAWRSAGRLAGGRADLPLGTSTFRNVSAGSLPLPLRVSCVWLATTLNWEGAADGRSAARRGLDLERAVQQRYALAHAQHPKPFGPSREVKASAIVSDAHLDRRRSFDDVNNAVCSRFRAEQDA